MFTVKRGDGSYTKYDLSVGTADTKYASCRVKYADPTTGKVIEGIAYAEDYKADAKNNQQLEVTAKVTSTDEAKTLAAKRLRLHNKYSRTVDLYLPGRPGQGCGGYGHAGGLGRMGRQIYCEDRQTYHRRLRLYNANRFTARIGGILMKH